MKRSITENPRLKGISSFYSTNRTFNLEEGAIVVFDNGRDYLIFELAHNVDVSSRFHMGAVEGTVLSLCPEKKVPINSVFKIADCRLPTKEEFEKYINSYGV